MAEELNNNVQVEETTETQEQPKDGKFYTEEEIEDMLQREGDRRISMYQKKVQKEQREAEKLKNMSWEDRREYELQQREADILAKETQLALAENKAVASSILAEKGISPKFVDFVVAEDAETMYENINLVEKEFKKCVRAEVEKRLSSSAPKTTMATDGMTKEQFRKLNYNQRVELKKADPDLFDLLSRN